MRVIEQSRLVDALAEWGKHEGVGRLELPESAFEGQEGVLNSVDVAVFCRSPLVWRILVGQPVHIMLVEIDADDVPHLRLADSRTIDKWKLAASADPEGFKHYRALAESDERIEGPLICTAKSDGSDGFVPPIVVFDGWHRVAAWTEQLEDDDYPIRAYLILTQERVPLLEPLI